MPLWWSRRNVDVHHQNERQHTDNGQYKCGQLFLNFSVLLTSLLLLFVRFGWLSLQLTSHILESEMSMEYLFRISPKSKATLSAVWITENRMDDNIRVRCMFHVSKKKLPNHQPTFRRSLSKCEFNSNIFMQSLAEQLQPLCCHKLHHSPQVKCGTKIANENKNKTKIKSTNWLVIYW